MTIEEQIYRNSTTMPHKAAIVCNGISLSYLELWDRISYASQWYEDKGFVAGDRIVLSADKNIEFPIWYFGAHLAGLICVPIDPETNPSRLKRILDCTSPSAIMGSLRHSDGLCVIPFPSEYSNQNQSVSVDKFPNESDIADLMFTTGTTGMPKGVSLSFGNESAAADNINTFIGNSSEDRELLALPISHSFGLGRLRCVLSVGGTLILLPSGFASMKKFYGCIESERVTGFGMVPASWAYITKMSGDRITRYADQLKYIEIGSAFLPVSEKQRLVSLLPNTKICMHYGLTEASRSTFICFNESADKLDSAGKASPNVEIKIFDNSGKALPAMTDGEVCVGGKHVCSGYWNQSKEDFKHDFYGEYFRTGDLGHIDSDGYLYLIGREKEIINVGGKKVSPLEVEEALNNIEGIEESACIGIPDKVMGEVVAAYIVSKSPVSEESLRKSLSARLENYKIPVVFTYIESLPKTPSGKLQRLALKNLV